MCIGLFISGYDEETVGPFILLENSHNSYEAPMDY